MKIIGTYPALRMRRNRKEDWIRRLVSEHNLSVNDLILPLLRNQNFLETVNIYKDEKIDVDCTIKEGEEGEKSTFKDTNPDTTEEEFEEFEEIEDLNKLRKKLLKK